MKKAWVTVFFLALSCKVFAQGFSESSYFGIKFGRLDKPSLIKIEDLFGSLNEGFNHFCFDDGKKFVSFVIDRDIALNVTALRSVELSSNNPGIVCQNFPEVLPAFNGFIPGQYSFEMIARLNAEGFHKTEANPNEARFSKDFLDAPLCHHQAASDYNAELYFYGSDKNTIHYTLSDVNASLVNTVTKHFSVGFREEINEECDAKNKI